MRKLWVVEFRPEYSEDWQTTCGVCLTRSEGRRELAEWRANNPNDKVRLVAYEPVQP